MPPMEWMPQCHGVGVKLCQELSKSLLGRAKADGPDWGEDPGEDLEVEEQHTPSDIMP